MVAGDAAQGGLDWLMPNTNCLRLLRLLSPLLLGYATAASALASAGPAVEVEAKWDGEFVTVAANADLDADAATAWRVLTDYEHFSEFIPDMVASRVLSRNGRELVVEHDGEFGLLFLRWPIHVLLAVALDPPRRIVAHSVGGDLRELRSSYDLTPGPRVLHIAYRARFLPAITLPPFVGLALVRVQMEKQFSAMVKEIERRNARGD